MSRVAVVTGGASGLGLSVCEHLGRQGRHLGVLDLDGAAAERAAADLRASGVAAIAVQVDVADRAAVDRAFALVRDELGPIEILVTSAAVAGFVPFEALSLDDWSRAITINLTGTFNCLQSAIRDMTASGWGRVVTISSAAAQIGSRHQAHYSASKGGVIALTKTVALEYASRGITVNTIAPFTIDTPMLPGMCRTANRWRRRSRPVGSAPAPTSPRCVRSCARTRQATPLARSSVSTVEQSREHRLRRRPRKRCREQGVLPP